MFLLCILWSSFAFKLCFATPPLWCLASHIC